MSEFADRVTEQLLALTRPDDLDPRIDRRRVRQLLAEAWTVGWMARGDLSASEVNPFLTGALSERAPSAADNG